MIILNIFFIENFFFINPKVRTVAVNKNILIIIPIILNVDSPYYYIFALVH
jgi:hypothetical protein